MLNKLIFVLQTSTHKEGVPDCRVWSLATACCRGGQAAAHWSCAEGVCAGATKEAWVLDSVAQVRRRGLPRR